MSRACVSLSLFILLVLLAPMPIVIPSPPCSSPTPIPSHPVPSHPTYLQPIPVPQSQKSPIPASRPRRRETPPLREFGEVAALRMVVHPVPATPHSSMPRTAAGPAHGSPTASKGPFFSQPLWPCSAPLFPWHEPLATTTRALPHLVAWTLIQYGLPSGFCSRRHVQASSLTQPSPHCSSLHHDDCLPLGLLPTTRAAQRRPISDSRPRRAGLHHPYPVLLPRFGLHGLCRSGRRAKVLVRARQLCTGTTTELAIACQMGVVSTAP